MGNGACHGNRAGSGGRVKRRSTAQRQRERRTQGCSLVVTRKGRHCAEQRHFGLLRRKGRKWLRPEPGCSGMGLWLKHVPSHTTPIHTKYPARKLGTPADNVPQPLHLSVQPPEWKKEATSAFSRSSSDHGLLCLQKKVPFRSHETKLSSRCKPVAVLRPEKPLPRRLSNVARRECHFIWFYAKKHRNRMPLHLYLVLNETPMLSSRDNTRNRVEK